MPRRDEFVTDVRRHVRAIWDNLNALEALQIEWTALDYGNTLGTIEGLTAAEVGPCVHATPDAIRALLATGHATNLAKLL